MSTAPDSTLQSEPNSPAPRRRRIPRALRWVLGIIGSVLLFIFIALTVVIAYLSPSRLTPLVTGQVNKIIDGHIDASRIELTFWHTFPHVSVDIDSLSLVSHSLRSLPDSTRRLLPADADSLLSFRHFHGSINVMKLINGDIALYDVTLSRPRLNLVVATDSLSNFDILPPSDSPDEPADSNTSLPAISINRFMLLNSRELSYFSLPDSISGSVILRAIDFTGSQAPVYSLDVEGDLSSPLLSAINSSSLLFAINGAVNWDPATPHILSVSDFTVAVGEIRARLGASLSLADPLTVNSLDLHLQPLDVSQIIRYVPEPWQKNFKGLDTDMTVALDATLTRPYCPSDTLHPVPSMHVALDIPQCRFNLADIHYNRFSLAATADVDGTDPDRSVVDISRLFIDGRALDLDVTGSVTHPMSDPAIDLTLKGRIIASRLPISLRRRIPGSLRATVGTNTRIRCRLGDFSPQRFHRIFARGTVSLRDLDYSLPDSLGADTTRIISPLALLKFNSGESRKFGDIKVDSLLTLSLTLDSLFYHGDGLTARLSEFKASLGSLNRASSSDTTSINPFGGRLSMRRLRIDSPADSLSLRLTRVEGKAALRRFNGAARIPLLHLDVEARSLGMATPTFKCALAKSAFAIDAHLNPRQRRVYASPADSINADSLRQARRAARRIADSIAALTPNLDLSVDSGLRQLLLRWKVAGKLSSSRGVLFTPAFPLPNRLRNLDLAFTTDSVIFNSLDYRAGRSDFHVSGNISNIRRAVAGRRGRSPLRMSFNLVSDTLDIDQIAAAVFSGAAATASGTRLDISSDDAVSDDLTESSADSVSSAESVAAFLVPANIDAELNLSASNVIYSGLLLHDLSGQLMVYDSAINLHDLRASSDVGSVAVSALYSAPAPSDVEFGMGMRLADFHIDRFLSFMPAIDSLMPVIKDFSGIINADIAATTMIDSAMNFVIPTLQAAIKIDGDSLVLLDADTFRSVSKWLLFKNKKRNMIDRMSVSMTVENSEIMLYPFIFDIDRYRLGVMGSNDLAMNLNYHVSVLKSPIPFKFGINIKGNVDNMKIRLGGAKIKEKNVSFERLTIADTTRINLVRELEGVFRRGANSAERARLSVAAASGAAADSLSRTLSAPDAPIDTLPVSTDSLSTLLNSQQ